MRILNKEQFKQEPYGTVYCLWIPDMFTDNLSIKRSARGEEFGESWWALDVIPWSDEDSREKDGGHFVRTEAFCTDDAIYNHDDEVRFAVFDKKEVVGMIDRLTRALASSN